MINRQQLTIIQELFPAFHYIFRIPASAPLQPQPKRMPLQSGLGIRHPVQKTLSALTRKLSW